MRKEPTPMALLVLGVLRGGPAHPYEILRRLAERRDDRHVRLSPGAVYHAVARLDRDGLVREAAVERQGNRPERTTYAITPAGSDALAAGTSRLVVGAEPEYAAFPAGLALLPSLDAGAALDALSARRRKIVRAIAGRRDRLDGLVGKGLPARFLLDAYFEVHQAESEIAWLDAIIGHLETGKLDWTTAPPPPGSDCTAEPACAEPESSSQAG